MPYVRLEDGRPTHACVGCRDGYYWGDPRTTRKGLFPCANIELRSVTVAVVAATYEGAAQSRAEALCLLTEAQRALLYPAACPACGRNHAINTGSLVRAYRQIVPELRKLCTDLPIQDYLRLAAVRGARPEEVHAAQLQFLAEAAFRRAS